MPESILSIIIFFPIIGMLILPFIKEEVQMKWTSAIITGITFLISVPLLTSFDTNNPSLQFVHLIPNWITSGKLVVNYHFGLDGVALLLFVLTTFLFFLSSIASWTYIHKREKEFYIALLALEVGVLGVFASANLVLFYVFWELMLIPMSLLIGVWGGENRIYAAVKFFIYTMAGSVLMLAVLIIYYKTGLISIEALSTNNLLNLSPELQTFLFFAFALSFAIKIPVFPVHTWLPDAHTEAPTAGSVILAGVMLKMGTYGFIRFCIPFYPAISLQYQNFFMILCVIGIIYGALVAMVQKDGKKLIAYSSVSHLGFCLLGLMTFTEEGVLGGMIQMLNHGVSTGMLFLMIGMMYERTHTRMIADYGGIAKIVPLFALFFMIAMLSSVGLPGMNGFVGEFLVLVGTLKVNVLYGILAGTGVVWAACYLLWFTKRFLFGEITNRNNELLSDLNLREVLTLIPFVILIFWFGIYPQTFMKYLEPSARVYLNSASTKAIAERTSTENKQELTRSYKTLSVQPPSFEERLAGFTTKYAILNVRNDAKENKKPSEEQK
jgi:NADH-quinone oxidoreductase subunit M